MSTNFPKLSCGRRKQVICCWGRGRGPGDRPWGSAALEGGQSDSQRPQTKGEGCPPGGREAWAWGGRRISSPYVVTHSLPKRPQHSIPSPPPPAQGLSWTQFPHFTNASSPCFAFSALRPDSLASPRPNTTTCRAEPSGL